MTDELRNRTWAVLPEEFKREVREIHKHYSNTYNAYQEGAFNAIKMIFGLHNLTAEEQPKPKFEVGDKVIVNGKFISAIYDIDTKNYPDCPYYIRKLDGYYGYFAESDLQLYTEPEETPNEDSSPEIGKDSTDSESELNLCELLADCVGMEFYSKWCGKCYLKSINPDGTNFTLTYNDGKASFWLLPNGKATEDGELMLFPSKDVRTWEGWQPYEYRLQSESKKYENIRERDAFLAGAQFAEDNLKYVK
jgi:hypothetical protein